MSFPLRINAGVVRFPTDLAVLKTPPPVGLLVPLQTEGRHEVRVSLEDDQTRILPFVVEFAQPAGA
jgi:hypothetical protein